MGEIKRLAPYFESLFHANLQQAWREAGYELTKRRDCFVPAHVSEECVRKFSRRTTVIEEAARRRGITEPERKAELGARTREKKDTSRSLSELRDEWRSRLTPEERAAIEEARARAMRVRAEREQQEQHRAADRTPQAERPVPAERPGDEARRAIARALDHAFERDSAVSEKRVLALAMKKMDAPVPPQDLAAALKEHSLIRQEVQGRVLLTTPAVLAEERSMLAFARAGRGTCAPLAADANPTGVGSLSQQHDAYRGVLGSYDRVTLLKGGAGTGRLALMKEITRAIENRGRRVFAFAPAGDHVRGPLQEAGAAETHTVAKLFADKTLQKSLRGQVLWIDQAGRLGVRGMARVFEIARKRDARVILSGDDKRHGPVERGGAFGLLARDAGVKAVELKAIERQRGDYRAALAAMADGRTDSAWKRLEKLGAVTQLPQREAHQQLAKEYVATTRRGVVKGLAIAPGRKEREQVTQAIRRELRETGRLKGKERRVDQLRSLGWTEAERRDGANYRRGQVIRFFRPTRGFRTGDRTRVLGRDALGNVWVKGKAGPQLLKTSHGDRFDVYEKGSLKLAKGDTVRITGGGKTAVGNHILRSGATHRVAGFVPLSGDLILSNGWVVRRSFGHLTHGYCVSSHTAQDKPVDRVFLAQSKESFGAASRQQFYAALGAARQGARVFTDDVQGLRQRVAVPEERPAATTLDEARLAARFDRHLQDMRKSHDHTLEPTL